MKKITFIFFLFLLLTVTSPVLAAEKALTPPKPLKTYTLSVLPVVSKQSIKINPPALELAVKTEPGDVSLRCGDNSQTYTCSSGKILKISSSAEKPIERFWAQSNANQDIRLKIAVYKQLDS